MGVFNSFGAIAGQLGAKFERDQVAAALVQQLKVPGNLTELLECFTSNGQGQIVQQWVSGETVLADGASVEQGLKQSTLLESLAAQTKLPTGLVKKALVVLMPLTISQLARTGYISTKGKVLSRELTEADLEGLANALR